MRFCTYIIEENLQNLAANAQKRKQKPCKRRQKLKISAAFYKVSWFYGVKLNYYCPCEVL